MDAKQLAQIVEVLEEHLRLLQGSKAELVQALRETDETAGLLGAQLDEARRTLDELIAK